MTGIGVDDTRMDLSQFDEARSVSTTPLPLSQPELIVSAGGQGELEQVGAPFIEGTEGAEVTPIDR